ncbi:MAG: DUF2784 domain-containing protein [Deltaproteobacteria bacterium]|nr:DUF2784 domain-containing protein [Deltaproteobacteria bacterium]
MLYRFLADFVVCFHLVFILFALLGGLFVIWKKWVLWIHLPAASWAALIEFKGWLCPLTPLENHFRRLAGEEGYGGSFIEHYLIPLIYPAGLTTEVQFLLGLLAIGVNLLVYGGVAYRWASLKP